ncbi:hypothetical protein [Corynebacterium aquatimens]|uniref:hypothetical protein n=1 Tax=Corynebacterium aquatimens TaxID=1190508 RepID=UPI00253F74F0|nr:hypothetical protein [Corynebacterium aquatimens]
MRGPAVGADGACVAHGVSRARDWDRRGDIKLAVPLGIAAAWCAGMAGMLLAVMLSSLLSVLAGVAMRRQTVPHGPAMLVATWTVVAVAGVPV